MEKLKKFNYKIVIAAVLTGLLVFVLAYADTNESSYSKFHKFVSNRLLYRGMESLDFKINDIFQPDNNVVQDMDVLVIGIDAYSMADSRMGSWNNWSRGVYADLLDKLHEDGCRPAAVCFDILFDKNGDAEGDGRFVEACKKYGDTIQGIHFTFDTKIIGVGVTYHVPVIADVTRPFDALYAASKVACTNNQLSQDSFARTLFVDTYGEEIRGNDYIPHEPVDSLAVAAYKQYLEYNGMEYVPHKYIAEKKNPIYFTYSRGVPRNDKPFNYMSIYDALYNYGDLANYCDGAIVFVGGYAAGMSDDFFTPATGHDKMYGVDIHVNTLEAIAQNKLQIPANRTAV
ncbi:MAG: CHASE2 domain-containing protein, partial [Lachnospiraceae bacterium]|nr:CHASE2 domain-containing protein [Lachnospiraceae bacterium]